MSIVAEIIERLRTDPDPVFRLVDGAAAFSEVKEAPHAVPAAFVFTAEEASSENERMTGPVMQRLEADIAIVIITRNLSDPRGAVASGDIEALKARVRARLVGFTPADAEPLEHVSSKLLKARAGIVWVEDVYATASYLEEET